MKKLGRFLSVLCIAVFVSSTAFSQIVWQEGYNNEMESAGFVCNGNDCTSTTIAEQPIVVYDLGISTDYATLTLNNKMTQTVSVYYNSLPVYLNIINNSYWGDNYAIDLSMANNYFYGEIINNNYAIMNYNINVLQTHFVGNIINYGSILYSSSGAPYGIVLTLNTIYEGGIINYGNLISIDFDDTINFDAGYILNEGNIGELNGGYNAINSTLASQITYKGSGNIYGTINSAGGWLFTGMNRTPINQTVDVLGGDVFYQGNDNHTDLEYNVFDEDYVQLNLVYVTPADAVKIVSDYGNLLLDSITLNLTGMIEAGNVYSIANSIYTVNINNLRIFVHGVLLDPGNYLLESFSQDLIIVINNIPQNLFWTEGNDTHVLERGYLCNGNYCETVYDVFEGTVVANIGGPGAFKNLLFNNIVSQEFIPESTSAIYITGLRNYLHLQNNSSGIIAARIDAFGVPLPYADGIVLDNTTYYGSITNNGQIGVVGGDISNPTEMTTGIKILNSSIMGIDADIITNTGLIKANENALLFRNTDVFGNIVNYPTGAIYSVNGAAVLFNGGSFDGSFINFGYIEGGTDAISIKNIVSAVNHSINLANDSNNPTTTGIVALNGSGVNIDNSNLDLNNGIYVDGNITSTFAGIRVANQSNMGEIYIAGSAESFITGGLYGIYIDNTSTIAKIYNGVNGGIISGSLNSIRNENENLVLLYSGPGALSGNIHTAGGLVLSGLGITVHPVDATRLAIFNATTGSGGMTYNNSLGDTQLNLAYTTADMGVAKVISNIGNLTLSNITLNLTGSINSGSYLLGQASGTVSQSGLTLLNNGVAFDSNYTATLRYANTDTELWLDITVEYYWTQGDNSHLTDKGFTCTGTNDCTSTIASTDIMIQAVGTSGDQATLNINHNVSGTGINISGINYLDINNTATINALAIAGTYNGYINNTGTLTALTSTTTNAISYQGNGTLTSASVVNGIVFSNMTRAPINNVTGTGGITYNNSLGATQLNLAYTTADMAVAKIISNIGNLTLNNVTLNLTGTINSGSYLLGQASGTVSQSALTMLNNGVAFDSVNHTSTLRYANTNKELWLDFILNYWTQGDNSHLEAKAFTCVGNECTSTVASADILIQNVGIATTDQATLNINHNVSGTGINVSGINYLDINNTATINALAISGIYTGFINNTGTISSLTSTTTNAISYQGNGTLTNASVVNGIVFSNMTRAPINNVTGTGGITYNNSLGATQLNLAYTVGDMNVAKIISNIGNLTLSNVTLNLTGTINSGSYLLGQASGTVSQSALTMLNNGVAFDSNYTSTLRFANTNKELWLDITVEYYWTQGDNSHLTDKGFTCTGTNDCTSTIASTDIMIQAVGTSGDQATLNINHNVSGTGINISGTNYLYINNTATINALAIAGTYNGYINNTGTLTSLTSTTTNAISYQGNGTLTSASVVNGIVFSNMTRAPINNVTGTGGITYNNSLGATQLNLAYTTADMAVAKIISNIGNLTLNNVTLNLTGTINSGSYLLGQASGTVSQSALTMLNNGVAFDSVNHTSTLRYANTNKELWLDFILNYWTQGDNSHLTNKGFTCTGNDCTSTEFVTSLNISTFELGVNSEYATLNLLNNIDGVQNLITINGSTYLSIENYGILTGMTGGLSLVLENPGSDIIFNNHGTLIGTASEGSLSLYADDGYNVMIRNFEIIEGDASGRAVRIDGSYQGFEFINEAEGRIVGEINFQSAYIVGDITNSGLIESGLNGIYLVGYVGAGVQFTGNIINDGTITAVDYGIYLEGSVYSGDIINGTTGDIFAINGGGVRIDGSTFTGNITNDGNIDSYLYGMTIQNNIFTGNILNDGLINSRGDGQIALYIFANGYAHAGNIMNSGEIQALGVDSTGIWMSYTTVFDGNIWNMGSIIGDGTGIHFEKFDNIDYATITGYIYNEGTISGGVYSINNLGNSLIDYQGNGTLIGALNSAGGFKFSNLGTVSAANLAIFNASTGANGIIYDNTVIEATQLNLAYTTGDMNVAKIISNIGDLTLSNITLNLTMNGGAILDGSYKLAQSNTLVSQSDLTLLNNGVAFDSNYTSTLRYANANKELWLDVVAVLAYWTQGDNSHLTDKGFTCAGTNDCTSTVASTDILIQNVGVATTDQATLNVNHNVSGTGINISGTNYLDINNSATINALAIAGTYNGYINNTGTLTALTSTTTNAISYQGNGTLTNASVVNGIVFSNMTRAPINNVTGTGGITYNNSLGATQLNLAYTVGDMNVAKIISNIGNLTLDSITLNMTGVTGGGAYKIATSNTLVSVTGITWLINSASISGEYDFKSSYRFENTNTEFWFDLVRNYWTEGDNTHLTNKQFVVSAGENGNDYETSMPLTLIGGPNQISIKNIGTLINQANLIIKHNITAAAGASGLSIKGTNNYLDIVNNADFRGDVAGIGFWDTTSSITKGNIINNTGAILRGYDNGIIFNTGASLNGYILNEGTIRGDGTATSKSIINLNTAYKVDYRGTGTLFGNIRSEGGIEFSGLGSVDAAKLDIFNATTGANGITYSNTGGATQLNLVYTTADIGTAKVISNMGILTLNNITLNLTLNGGLVQAGEYFLASSADGVDLSNLTYWNNGDAFNLANYTITPHKVGANELWLTVMELTLSYWTEGNNTHLDPTKGFTCTGNDCTSTVASADIVIRDVGTVTPVTGWANLNIESGDNVTSALGNAITIGKTAVPNYTNYLNINIASGASVIGKASNDGAGIYIETDTRGFITIVNNGTITGAVSGSSNEGAIRNDSALIRVNYQGNGDINGRMYSAGGWEFSNLHADASLLSILNAATGSGGVVYSNTDLKTIAEGGTTVDLAYTVGQENEAKIKTSSTMLGNLTLNNINLNFTSAYTNNTQYTIASVVNGIIEYSELNLYNNGVEIDRSLNSLNYSLSVDKKSLYLIISSLWMETDPSHMTSKGFACIGTNSHNCTSGQNAADIGINTVGSSGDFASMLIHGNHFMATNIDSAVNIYGTNYLNILIGQGSDSGFAKGIRFNSGTTYFGNITTGILSSITTSDVFKYAISVFETVYGSDTGTVYSITNLNLIEGINIKNSNFMANIVNTGVLNVGKEGYALSIEDSNFGTAIRNSNITNNISRIIAGININSTSATEFSTLYTNIINYGTITSINDVIKISANTVINGFIFNDTTGVITIDEFTSNASDVVLHSENLSRIYYKGNGTLTGDIHVANGITFSGMTGNASETQGKIPFANTMTGAGGVTYVGIYRNDQPDNTYNGAVKLHLAYVAGDLSSTKVYGNNPKIVSTIGNLNLDTITLNLTNAGNAIIDTGSYLLARATNQDNSTAQVLCAGELCIEGAFSLATAVSGLTFQNKGAALSNSADRTWMLRYSPDKSELWLDWILNYWTQGDNTHLTNKNFGCDNSGGGATVNDCSSTVIADNIRIKDVGTATDLANLNINNDITGFVTSAPYNDLGDAISITQKTVGYQNYLKITNNAVITGARHGIYIGTGVQGTFVINNVFYDANGNGSNDDGDIFGRIAGTGAANYAILNESTSLLHYQGNGAISGKMKSNGGWRFSNMTVNNNLLSTLLNTVEVNTTGKTTIYYGDTTANTFFNLSYTAGDMTVAKIDPVQEYQGTGAGQGGVDALNFNNVQFNVSVDNSALGVGQRLKLAEIDTVSTGNLLTYSNITLKNNGGDFNATDYSAVLVNRTGKDLWLYYALNYWTEVSITPTGNSHLEAKVFNCVGNNCVFNDTYMTSASDVKIKGVGLVGDQAVLTNTAGHSITSTTRAIEILSGADNYLMISNVGTISGTQHAVYNASTSRINYQGNGTLSGGMYSAGGWKYSNLGEVSATNLGILNASTGSGGIVYTTETAGDTQLNLIYASVADRSNSKVKSTMGDLTLSGIILNLTNGIEIGGSYLLAESTNGLISYDVLTILNAGNTISDSQFTITYRVVDNNKLWLDITGPVIDYWTELANNANGNQHLLTRGFSCTGNDCTSTVNASDIKIKGIGTSGNQANLNIIAGNTISTTGVNTKAIEILSGEGVYANNYLTITNNGTISGTYAVYNNTLSQIKYQGNGVLSGGMHSLGGWEFSNMDRAPIADITGGAVIYKSYVANDTVLNLSYATANVGDAKILAPANLTLDNGVIVNLILNSGTITSSGVFKIANTTSGTITKNNVIFQNNDANFDTTNHDLITKIKTQGAGQDLWLYYALKYWTQGDNTHLLAKDFSCSGNDCTSTVDALDIIIKNVGTILPALDQATLNINHAITGTGINISETNYLDINVGGTAGSINALTIAGTYNGNITTASGRTISNLTVNNGTYTGNVVNAGTLTAMTLNGGSFTGYINNTGTLTTLTSTTTNAISYQGNGTLGAVSVANGIIFSNMDRAPINYVTGSGTITYTNTNGTSKLNLDYSAQDLTTAKIVSNIGNLVLNNTTLNLTGVVKGGTYTVAHATGTVSQTGTTTTLINNAALNTTEFEALTAGSYTVVGNDLFLNLVRAYWTEGDNTHLTNKAFTCTGNDCTSSVAVSSNIVIKNVGTVGGGVNQAILNVGHNATAGINISGTNYLDINNTATINALAIAGTYNGKIVNTTGTISSLTSTTANVINYEGNGTLGTVSVVNGISFSNMNRAPIIVSGTASASNGITYTGSNTTLNLVYTNTADMTNAKILSSVGKLELNGINLNLSVGGNSSPVGSYHLASITAAGTYNITYSGLTIMYAGTELSTTDYSFNYSFLNGSKDLYLEIIANVADFWTQNDNSHLTDKLFACGTEPNNNCTSTVASTDIRIKDIGISTDAGYLKLDHNVSSTSVAIAISGTANWLVIENNASINGTATGFAIDNTSTSKITYQGAGSLIGKLRSNGGWELIGLGNVSQANLDAFNTSTGTVGGITYNGGNTRLTLNYTSANMNTAKVISNIGALALNNITVDITGTNNLAGTGLKGGVYHIGNATGGNATQTGLTTLFNGVALNSAEFTSMAYDTVVDGDLYLTLVRAYWEQNDNSHLEAKAFTCVGNECTSGGNNTSYITIKTVGTAGDYATLDVRVGDTLGGTLGTIINIASGTNYLNINNRGTINGSTGFEDGSIGIQSSAVMYGNINNYGSSKGIYVDGILNGDIINNVGGTITGFNPVGAFQGTITGNIKNYGTITSTSGAIWFNQSTLNGYILNEGTITAGLGPVIASTGTFRLNYQGNGTLVGGAMQSDGGFKFSNMNATTAMLSIFNASGKKTGTAADNGIIYDNTGGVTTLNLAYTSADMSTAKVISNIGNLTLNNVSLNLTGTINSGSYLLGQATGTVSQSGLTMLNNGVAFDTVNHTSTLRYANSNKELWLDFILNYWTQGDNTHLTNKAFTCTGTNDCTSTIASSNIKIQNVGTLVDTANLIVANAITSGDVAIGITGNSNYLVIKNNSSITGTSLAIQNTGTSRINYQGNGIISGGMYSAGGWEFSNMTGAPLNNLTGSNGIIYSNTGGTTQLNLTYTAGDMDVAKIISNIGDLTLDTVSLNLTGTIVEGNYMLAQTVGGGVVDYNALTLLMNGAAFGTAYNYTLSLENLDTELWINVVSSSLAYWTQGNNTHLTNKNFTCTGTNDCTSTTASSNIKIQSVGISGTDQATLNVNHNVTGGVAGAIAFELGTNYVDITNTATISGNIGINVISGTIVGDLVNNGVISGTTKAISFAGENDTLNYSGTGKVNGIIDMGAGNDTVNVSNVNMKPADLNIVNAEQLNFADSVMNLIYSGTPDIGNAKIHNNYGAMDFENTEFGLTFKQTTTVKELLLANAVDGITGNLGSLSLSGIDPAFTGLFEIRGDDLFFVFDNEVTIIVPIDTLVPSSGTVAGRSSITAMRSVFNILERNYMNTYNNQYYFESLDFAQETSSMFDFGVADMYKAKNDQFFFELIGGQENYNGSKYVSGYDSDIMGALIGYNHQVGTGWIGLSLAQIISNTTMDVGASEVKTEITQISASWGYDFNTAYTLLVLGYSFGEAEDQMGETSEINTMMGQFTLGKVRKWHNRTMLYQYARVGYAQSNAEDVDDKMESLLFSVGLDLKYMYNWQQKHKLVPSIYVEAGYDAMDFPMVMLGDDIVEVPAELSSDIDDAEIGKLSGKLGVELNYIYKQNSRLGIRAETTVQENYNVNTISINGAFKF